MPDLRFAIEEVRAVPRSAVAAVAIVVGVEETSGAAVSSVLLRCQVRIEPARREYSTREQAGLHDLFGPPSRWDETLRAWQWANVTVVVPQFAGKTSVEVPVPCGVELGEATTRYFTALEDGAAPIGVYFAGTVFHESAGALRAAPIPWNREAHGEVRAAVVREALRTVHPSGVPLRLDEALARRLEAHRARLGLATADAALEDLLARVEVRS